MEIVIQINNELDNGQLFWVLYGYQVAVNG
jgi:hypothetical protein